MKTHLIAAALIVAASSSFAQAENLTEKAMHDHPGHVGAGTTANPTAKPDSYSLDAKVMSDNPGVAGKGRTVNANAQPDSHSLSGKVMKEGYVR